MFKQKDKKINAIYAQKFCLSGPIVRYSGLQLRVCTKNLIFLFLNKNICCGYSQEPCGLEGSFEHPKHMFKLMNKKKIATLHSKVLLNWSYTSKVLGPVVKSAYQKFHFLISKPKHMLWVLKRTVSMSRFFWAPKTYVKTDG